MRFDKPLKIPNDFFDADQTMEINTGISQELDVSAYAEAKFMAIQMRQIRLGLADDLNVSVYAKPEYDWFQMEEIRKGMLAGINYNLYADPSVDYRQMRQIRKGLQAGIDMSEYIDINPGALRELRKAILNKVDLLGYIKEGYDVEQLEQIRLALEKKLDISPYLIKEFRGSAIGEIRLGLEEGIDPSVYAKIDYGWQQMRELRFGLEKRLDVSRYANPLFSWQQMRELRLGLEDGIDISSYRSFVYTATDMERIRRKLTGDMPEEELSGKNEIADYAKFSVFVSSDEMEAGIEVHGNENLSVTRQEIIEALKKEKIVAGISEKEIDSLIRERKFDRKVIIARGKPSVRGKDGWYEYFIDTNIERQPKYLPDGTLDYGDVKWYEIVREGQKIAYYHEAEYGKPGFTVTGKYLAVKKGHEKKVLLGKGFVLLPDGKTYISAINGKIDRSDDANLDISRMLVVDQVDSATGNINFDGCVYVRGNVGKGALICASEDVIVGGHMEAAFIKCGGEVLIRQGVGGGNTGIIEANGDVTAQFLDAVKVFTRGDIHTNFSRNSQLQAGGSIVIGGLNGTLLGGASRAVNEIHAANIGSHFGTPTVLRLGAEDSVIIEKQSLERRIEEVTRELAILGNGYVTFQRKHPPEVRNTMKTFLKIENAIYTKEMELDHLHRRVSELKEVIDSRSGAKVVVRNAIYQGTVIIIDDQQWSAFNLKNVTVKCIDHVINAYSN